MSLRRTIWVGLLLAVVAGVTTFPVMSPPRPYSANYDDPDPVVRAAAVRQAGRRDVSLIARALKDADPDVRLVAVMGLAGQLGLPAYTAPALIETLKDPNAYVRRKATEALTNIGESAVPALCQALADPDPRVRVGAVRALGEMLDPEIARDPSPEAVATVTPLVQKLLDDPDPDVRAYASLALKGIRSNR
jgi:HEAT repeat protein